MDDGAAPFGVYLVDKPAGPTSHGVLVTIRRNVGRGVKVGHAGTLDPFATGLLVVAVGRATRLLQFLTGHDKTYIARVRLGATSVTGDPEGPISPTGRPLPTASDVAAAVAALPSQTSQRVPAFSAVKVEGEALYKRARRGDEVPVTTRPIAIRSATLLETDPEGNWFDLEVTCAKGTYIRQVAVDLGDVLGCGAYCESLRRTHVAGLSVMDAVVPEDVPARGAVDLQAALAPMPARQISAAALEDIAHGRPIAALDGPLGPVALVHDGQVAAIAALDGAGHLRPRVVLA